MQDVSSLSVRASVEALGLLLSEHGLKSLWAPSRRAGFSSCGAWAWLPGSMWDLGPGIKLVSPLGVRGLLWRCGSAVADHRDRDPGRNEPSRRLPVLLSCLIAYLCFCIFYISQIRFILFFLSFFLFFTIFPSLILQLYLS